MNKSETSPASLAILVLSLTSLLASSLGVPSEEVLQDTFKSAIVSFGTLLAGILLWWGGRNKPITIKWHSVILLPFGLMVYAFVSMAWSHAYLASVEAIRWLIFCLIIMIAINALTKELVFRLLNGVHIGLTIASVWIILQYLSNFDVFPQGAIPASTFVNRNFFAEFSVAVLPLSFYLLLSNKPGKSLYIFAASVGLNIAALLMTGTRSAMVCFLLIILALPLFIFRYKKQLIMNQWKYGVGMMVFGIAFTLSLGLSVIPTENQNLINDFGKISALDRAFSRTLSLTKRTEYSEGSFSIRTSMWKSTWRMIRANPLSGVGAGAWEVEAPLFQEDNTYLETDFYAHNEFLQLVAEYGVAGWIFLFLLVAYLSKSFFYTWKSDNTDAPLKAFTIASLLALFFVSMAGFPWRLACTGMLFALCVSILLFFDIKAQNKTLFFIHGNHSFTKLGSRLLLCFLSLSLLLCLLISQRAFACETNFVRAAKIALTITKSGQPDSPYWNSAKNEMLQLLSDGFAINKHYRKLAPISADEMAGWGDWKNATWIWEIIYESRPNVIAFATNISRGYLEMGDIQKSKVFLERAREIHPESNAIKSMEALILLNEKKFDEARPIVAMLIGNNYLNYDTVYAAYSVGVQTKDWSLASQALNIRIKKWPQEAYDGWLKLGDIYAKTEIQDKTKAADCYRNALQTAPLPLRDFIFEKIPLEYRKNIN